MEGQMMIGIFAIGLVMLLGNAAIVNAVSCSDALTTLNPCLPYLVGSSPTPNPTCCLAVEKVKDEANTPEIRRDLCKCFKAASGSFGINPGKAKQLPDFCHVQLPVPIDPKIDCSKITV